MPENGDGRSDALRSCDDNRVGSMRLYALDAWVRHAAILVRIGRPKITPQHVAHVQHVLLPDRLIEVVARVEVGSRLG